MFFLQKKQLVFFDSQPYSKVQKLKASKTFEKFSRFKYNSQSRLCPIIYETQASFKTSHVHPYATQTLKFINKKLNPFIEMK